MKFLTASEAIRQIAPFVGLDVDNDRERLFLYLTFAQKMAWKAGTYKGFMREFDVATYEVNGHRFLKTPHGYNVLMGINLNTKPTQIQDSYFQFHHNSMGSLTDERVLSFVNYALAYREYATMLGPNLLMRKEAFKVLAIAMEQETDKRTIIGGIDVEGNPIMSSVDGNTIDGTRVLLEHNIAKLVDDYWYADVSHISKDQTNGPVNYYANYESGDTVHIARLEAFQTNSMYRIYQVPKSVECGCSAHCLFKISEPDPIVSESQRLIIDDMEALLSLCMGMDQSYDKKDLNLGESFIGKGIMSLDRELKSASSPVAPSIQYIGMDNDVEDYFM